MDEHGTDNSSVRIRINGKESAVPQGPITAAAIRALADATADVHSDLFFESPGLGEDRMLNDTDVIDVRDGMSFFLVPRYIVAG